MNKRSAACALVEAPGSGVDVWARQGRSGCSGSTTLTAQLKRDIPLWGDPVDAALAATGTPISRLPYEPCSAHGRATYDGSAHSNAGINLVGHHHTVC